MMIGSKEADILAADSMAAAAPELLDDFEEREDGEELDVKDRPENIAKLQRRINTVQVSGRPRI